MASELGAVAEHAVGLGATDRQRHRWQRDDRQARRGPQVGHQRRRRVGDLEQHVGAPLVAAEQVLVGRDERDAERAEPGDVDRHGERRDQPGRDAGAVPHAGGGQVRARPARPAAAARARRPRSSSTGRASASAEPGDQHASRASTSPARRPAAHRRDRRRWHRPDRGPAAPAATASAATPARPRRTPSGSSRAGRPASTPTATANATVTPTTTTIQPGATDTSEREPLQPPDRPARAERRQDAEQHRAQQRADAGDHPRLDRVDHRRLPGRHAEQAQAGDPPVARGRRQPGAGREEHAERHQHEQRERGGRVPTRREDVGAGRSGRPGCTAAGRRTPPGRAARRARGRRRRRRRTRGARSARSARPGRWCRRSAAGTARAARASVRISSASAGETTISPGAGSGPGRAAARWPAWRRRSRCGAAACGRWRRRSRSAAWRRRAPDRRCTGIRRRCRSCSPRCRRRRRATGRVPGRPAPGDRHRGQAGEHEQHPSAAPDDMSAARSSPPRPDPTDSRSPSSTQRS